MIQRRVRVTSLREDLKAIGLLREGEEEPKPADQDVEDEEDEEPAPDSEPTPPTEEEDDDKKKPEGDLEKAMEALGILAGGYLKRHKKIEHRSPKQRNLAKLAEGKATRPAKPAPKPGRKIESLLEDVSGLLHDIRRSKLEQKIRGFANVALIADSLADRFKTIGMRLSEGNLYRVARVMRKLSEQASDMAIGLDEPPGKEREEDEDEPTTEKPTSEQGPPDDVQVDALFKKFMAKLLDALQLYNDVTGQSEADEEPEPPAEPAEEDEEEPDDEEPEPAEEDEDEPPAEPEDEEPTEEQDDEDKPKEPEDEKAVGEARKMLATLRRRYVRECSRGKAPKRESRMKKESRAKAKTKSKKRR